MKPVLTEALQQTIIGVHQERGMEWISNFGQLLQHCEERWRVHFLAPYPPSYHFVAPVVFPDGTEAVFERLKPGRTLHSVSDDEEAVRIAADIMQKIARPAPFRLLVRMATTYILSRSCSIIR